MLINKKTVRKNKALRAAQRGDRKENRDRRLERGSVLKRNIEKVVTLSSQTPIGSVAAAGELTRPESARELIERVEAAGLTGMSGSGFPVAEKLKGFLESEASEKIILINGAECEPGLINDAWLMREKAPEIIDGAAALRQAFAPARIVLATRGRAEYMTGADTKGLELLRLPLKYPLGEEYFLIEQALGKKLDRSVPPAKQGVLVMNVQTVWQIARILSGSFDGGRYVTLASLKTGEARVAYVHPGDGVEAALRQGFGDIDGEVYFGGGVGRAEKATPDAAFSDTTAFAAISGKVMINNANSCKKCGGCSKKCPMNIKVRDIVLLRQKNPDADISELGADRCIGCGTCTYFCMAGKDPLAYIMG